MWRFPWPAGAWTIGGFPFWVTLCTSLTLFGAAMNRGIDYALGDSPNTARRLGAVEMAAPLWVWGVLFATAATCGFCGLILRRWQPVFCGHLTSWAMYWAIALGLVMDVFARRGEYEPTMNFTIVLPILVMAVAVAGVLRYRDTHAYIALAASVVVVFFAALVLDLDGLRNATALVALGSVHALMALGIVSVEQQSRVVLDRIREARE